MYYRIEAETKHRIRIRIGSRKLSDEQAKILKYAFSCAPGVTGVTVYKASAGCAITYTGDRFEIIRRLNSFNFENVQMMAEKEEENARISAEKRKRTPGSAPKKCETESSIPSSSASSVCAFSERQ